MTILTIPADAAKELDKTGMKNVRLAHADAIALLLYYKENF